MLRNWIWLSTRNDVEKARRIELLTFFGSAEALYFADEAALRTVPDLTQKELRSLLDKSQSEAEEILCRCYELGISLLCWQDAQYPQRLRNIPDPPVLLYYKGRLPNFDATACISLVGARKASAFGMLTAKRLGYQLGSAGIIVVSGLAEGIDAMGMTGALMAGAKVVGVLGNGADIVYPVQNRSLYRDTMQQGCILTEYPPGTPPKGYHFPQRNRIISGLSDGVVVVEAAEKSGSLITARRALDQGRDVFAVPGNAGSDACAGSNGLLREGAIFAEHGADILREYVGRFPQLLASDSREQLELSPEDVRCSAEFTLAKNLAKVASDEQVLEKSVDKQENSAYIVSDEVCRTLLPEEAAIVDLLREKPHSVDDMMDLLELPAHQVMSALTMLEVRGLIARQHANVYALKRTL